MMFYYPHHIGDFIRDTANLSDSQTMAYLRMLWKYYGDESPLVGPCDRIAFAVRSDEKTVALILGHYFTETPDGWRHSRCDSVISAFYEKSEKAAASARKRWEHANALKNDANALRTDSERNADAPKNDATQYPIPNTQQPEKIKNKKPRTASPVAELDFSSWPSKPSDGILSEWLAVKKRKKAPVTPFVLEQVGKELHAAAALGWTVDDALAEAVTRNWQGLKASWLGPKNGSLNGGKPTAADNFHGKKYESTPVDQMPDYLRDGYREAEQAGEMPEAR